MNKFELVETSISKNSLGKNIYKACFNGFNRWKVTIAVEEGDKDEFFYISALPLVNDRKQSGKYLLKIYFEYGMSMQPQDVFVEFSEKGYIPVEDISTVVNEFNIAAEAVEEIKRRFLNMSLEDVIELVSAEQANKNKE